VAEALSVLNTSMRSDRRVLQWLEDGGVRTDSQGRLSLILQDSEGRDAAGFTLQLVDDAFVVEKTEAAAGVPVWRVPRTVLESLAADDGEFMEAMAAGEPDRLSGRETLSA